MGTFYSKQITLFLWEAVPIHRDELFTNEGKFKTKFTIAMIVKVLIVRCLSKYF